MGGQQAPPEPAVLASLGVVSISDCLLGTRQSGHMSESLDRSLRGLKRCFETRMAFGMAPTSLSYNQQEYHTEPGCRHYNQDQDLRLRLEWDVQSHRIK